MTGADSTPQQERSMSSHPAPRQHPAPLRPDSHHTVALVGCNGFVGSHLVRRLLADTVWTVRGIDRETHRVEGLRDHPRFAFTTGDYRDAQWLNGALPGCDAVINLASLCNPALYNTQPLAVMDSNFRHPLALVEACARHRLPLIHLSSSEVHGRTLASYGATDGATGGTTGTATGEESLLSEERSPYLLGPLHESRWSYAAAKQLLERYIHAHGEQGLPWTIVRPFNFVGPHMDYLPGVDGEGTPRVIACFMEALLQGRPLTLVDGGTNRRCFTGIDDAVEALFRILLRLDRCDGQVINIGNPANETTIAGLAEQMRNLFARWRGCDLDEIPAQQNVSSEEFYGAGYADSDRRLPDISRARDLLDWNPKVQLDTALAETIAWFGTHYAEHSLLAEHAGAHTHFAQSPRTAQ